ncbi:MAG: GHKL domain-containing protein [Saprospiraceae bacterium]|nr:GHKL domain-containing protein [Saprospiraceae bacterium]
MNWLNKYEYQITMRVVLLFCGIIATSYFILHETYLISFVCGCFVCYQSYALIRFLNRTNIELTQFVEAIQYRDFTQSFNTKSAPLSVRNLRKAFNVVNQTFKKLSSEKEIQYQYLHKLLQMVDTGILSYNESGDIKWINDSLKKMLDIPYLHTIDALEKRNAELYHAIKSLKSNENVLFKLNQKQVLLSKTQFQEQGETSTLVAVQNVSNAIDETETVAWQKLLRVMTHEIMNSVAPIASLADTLQGRLLSKDTHQLEDLTQGMEVIKKRSEGLLRFASVYRNFSKINITSFDHVNMIDLFSNIKTLMSGPLKEKSISFDAVLSDAGLMIHADINLMEQVLINLLVNAIDAVKDTSNPNIILSAKSAEHGKVMIEVIDNGTGLDPEIIDQIFVPFFTTKSNGSGIGLSLSKQIISLHKGSIHVQSEQGKGSKFILII